MKKLETTNRAPRRISSSTIWTIAIIAAIVAAGVFMVWLQSTHH